MKFKKAMLIITNLKLRTCIARVYLSQVGIFLLITIQNLANKDQLCNKRVNNVSFSRNLNHQCLNDKKCLSTKIIQNKIEIFN